MPKISLYTAITTCKCVCFIMKVEDVGKNRK